MADYPTWPIDYFGDCLVGQARKISRTSTALTSSTYSRGSRGRVNTQDYIERNISLFLSPEKFAVFRGWFQHHLYNGVRPFYFTLVGEESPRIVRVVDSTYSFQLDGDTGNFRVSFVIDYKYKRDPRYIGVESTDTITADTDFSGGLINPYLPETGLETISAGVSFGGHLSAIIKPDDTDTVAADVDFDGNLVTAIEQDDTETIMAAVSFSGSLV